MIDPGLIYHGSIALRSIPGQSIFYVIVLPIVNPHNILTNNVMRLVAKKQLLYFFCTTKNWVSIYFRFELAHYC